MKVNLGYVAIALKLEEGSPNKTTTYKNLSKLEPKLWHMKLKDIAIKNIESTERIIRYNSAYGIKLYRMTSKIIPLATHKEVAFWDWESDLKPYFEKLGRTIRECKARVSTHPDHFVLLNSPRKEVLEASIKDLEYHMKMYNLMGLSESSKMVLHIGGMYGDKESALERFYRGFDVLSDEIKNRIILENDDKIYTAKEVLNVAKTLEVPMVLDVHHNKCNPSEAALESIISSIYDTWKKEEDAPKIHFSSPKCEKDFRAHHDYIESEDFIEFINMSKKVDGRDIDVMIEAKKKDLSVFKLIDDIKSCKNIDILSDASFNI